MDKLGQDHGTIDVYVRREGAGIDVGHHIAVRWREVERIARERGWRYDAALLLAARDAAARDAHGPHAFWRPVGGGDSGLVVAREPGMSEEPRTGVHRAMVAYDRGELDALAVPASEVIAALEHELARARERVAVLAAHVEAGRAEHVEELGKARAETDRLWADLSAALARRAPTSRPAAPAEVVEVWTDPPLVDGAGSPGEEWLASWRARLSSGEVVNGHARAGDPQRASEAATLAARAAGGAR